MSFKIGDAFVEVNVRDNTAGDARRIEDRLNRIRGTAHVDVDVDDSGLTRASGRMDSFTRETTGRAGLITAALVGIGAAAGFAGAAISALPGIASSLGGMAGVLIGSFHGIGDALKGYGADQEAAGKASSKTAATELANARQIRDAQESIADARRKQAQVAQDSSERVADAQRNEAKVARDTADAVAAAQQRVVDAQHDAARVAEDSADQIAQAQQRVIDAQDDVARAAERGAEAIDTAERRVMDAMADEERAQRSLTEARADAARQLEDLAEKVHDLALDQEGAAISLEEAQDRYDRINADAKSTDLDRRKAAYQLATAQERVRDLTRESTEATQEANEANAKGIEGNDKVITARERLVAAEQKVQDAQADVAKAQQEAAEAQTQALRKVEDAQRDLAKTQRDAAQAQTAATQKVQDAQANLVKVQRDGAEAQQEAARRTQKAVEDGAQAQENAAIAVSKAMQGLVDAQAQQAASATLAGAATSKFAEAMAKLNPQQRELVEQLLRMKPLVEGMQDAGSRTFLPGLVSMLRDSEGLFPIFEGHLERTGAIMGDTARKFGDLFRSEEFQTNLDAMFRSSEPITRAIGDLFVNFADRFVRFGAEMAPVATAFASFLDHTSAGLSKLFDTLAPNADTFARIWEGLGRVMEALLPILGEVINTLANVLAPVLETVAGWMERNHDHVDDLVVGLLALFTAFKAVQVVSTVASWATAVITHIDNIGKSAKESKRLIGLLKAGLIGGAAGGALAGIGELAPGEFGDGGQSPIQEGTNAAGEIGKGILSGDIGHIWDVISTEWSHSFDQMRSGDSPIQRFGAWLGEWSSGTVASVGGFFSRLPGDFGNWFGQAEDSATMSLGSLRDDAGQLASDAWNSLSTRFTTLRDDATNWFGGLRDSASERLTNLRDSAGELGQSLWDNLSQRWGRLRDDAFNWFGSARDTASERLTSLRDSATELGQSLWDNLSQRFGRLRDDALGWFGSMRDTANERMGSLRDALSSIAEDARVKVSGAFQALLDTIRSLWDGLREAVAIPVRFVVNTVWNNGILKAWNEVVGLFGGKPIGPVVLPFAAGGQVPGSGDSDTVPAVLTPGEFVVRKAIAQPTRNFLEALNSGQAEAFQAAGGANARVQAFAEGGPVQAGLDFARAQNGKPYVWGGVGPVGYDCSGFMSAITNVLRGRSPYSRLGTTHTMPWPGFTPGLTSQFGTGWSSEHMAGTLAGQNVEAGGSPSRTKFVTNAAGATHPQFGGHASLPQVGGVFTGDPGGGGGIDLSAMVTGVFKRLTDPLINALPGPPPQFKELIRGFARTARDKLVEKAVSAVGLSAGPTGSGGGSSRWTPVINQALAIQGQPGSLLGTVIRRMDQESGGNPTAVNRTDINWRNGTPSVGLMQVIGPTYRSYKHPQHDVGPYLYNVSTDPLSNILASMRYAMGRYGSLASAYNRAGGYDDGGILPPGLTLANNSTGRPERVLTAQQTESFDRLVDALTNSGNRGAGGVTVNVTQTSGSPAETGRFVALALRTVS